MKTTVCTIVMFGLWLVAQSGLLAADDENVVRGRKTPAGRLSFRFSGSDTPDCGEQAPLPATRPYTSPVLTIFAGRPLEPGLLLDFVPLRRQDFPDTVGLRALPLWKSGPLFDLRVSRIGGDGKAFTHNLGAANWMLVPWHKEYPWSIEVVQVPLVYAGNLYGREVAPPGWYRIDLRMRLELLGSDGKARTVDCTAAPLWIAVIPTRPGARFYESWLGYCVAARYSSTREYFLPATRRTEWLRKTVNAVLRDAEMSGAELDPFWAAKAAEVSGNLDQACSILLGFHGEHWDELRSWDLRVVPWFRPSLFRHQVEY